MVSQHRFRWWLCAVSGNKVLPEPMLYNADPNLCRHMASLGHNKFIHIYGMYQYQHFQWFKYFKMVITILTSQHDQWLSSTTRRQQCRLAQRWPSVGTVLPTLHQTSARLKLLSGQFSKQSLSPRRWANVAPTFIAVWNRTAYDCQQSLDLHWNIISVTS